MVRRPASPHVLFWLGIAWLVIGVVNAVLALVERSPQSDIFWVHVLSAAIFLCGGVVFLVQARRGSRSS